VIVVVCLNPALDVTHHVPAVDWAGVNRPVSVSARPGGKGLNVARTLRTLDADVLLMGLIGGITGAGVQAALSELAVPAALTPIAAETRRTFTVVDGAGSAALFSEPGPRVSELEFAAFRGQYEQALKGTTAVVLSGSLPPGLAAATYAELIETASKAGVPAVLDAHGDALARGAAAGPAIVKPNIAELQAIAAARRLSTPGGADAMAVTAAAEKLRAAGARSVVASLGPEGLLAVTGDGGRWRARPPMTVAGNETGAGDAVVAALAHGLAVGRPWDERLRHAVALGAACAAAPVAGEYSHAVYLSALRAATVYRDQVG
jgi:1-phosphofructokinase family hexose kinase